MGTQGSSKVGRSEAISRSSEALDIYCQTGAEAGVDLQPKIEDVWKLSSDVQLVFKPLHAREQNLDSTVLVYGGQTKFPSESEGPVP